MSVFTKEDDRHIPNKGPSNFNNMPDINITENGVYKLLKNLNVNKAEEPDYCTNFSFMAPEGALMHGLNPSSQTGN